MWVNSRKKILTICLLYLITTSNLGICSDCDDATTSIKAGYKLVENFYSCLTSDLKQDFCSKLFTNSPYLPKNNVDLIWEFSKKNKQLFIRDIDNRKDNNFFKWARKTVSYYNPRNLDRVGDGYLYITIVHTLSGRFYSGISKEIAFPIDKDETSGEYRIDFLRIKVNGIIIDYNNEFVRDFDIIKSLGFNSETEISSSTPKKSK